MISDTPNPNIFSSSEAKVLRELSSFDFGFIKFNSPKGQVKKQILEKAIISLDTSLSYTVKEFKDKRDEELNNLKDNKQLTSVREVELYNKYSKLLSEAVDPHIYLYLEFESLNIDNWKNVPFLYGLAVCYFHFNAFDKAIELFQTILYVEPSCSRAKEIHIRLGYVHKLNTHFDCSLRHFRRALNDTVRGSFSETEIRFQIAHLLEVCGKYKLAQKAYELLISYNKDEVPDHIKHLCYRQLGWLHYSGCVKPPVASNNSPNNAKKDSVISLLHQAIALDDSSGKTWYLFGRAQAKENKVQEAFMAYRNSIDKTEANADTWCSIGVLYQEQNQPMDALQAYFCACQLDRKHVAAWTNLGVLYESMGQHGEALKCYQNAVSSDKNNEIRPEIKERMNMIQKFLSFPEASSPAISPQTPGLKPGQAQQKMRPTAASPAPATLPAQSSSSTAAVTNPGAGGLVMKLPTVDEAWNLPIPTELTQRQMQLELQEAVSSSSSVGGGAAASRLYAHNLPPYLTTTSASAAATAASTPSTAEVGMFEQDGGSKRRKLEEVPEQLIMPLNPQQVQVLAYLESQSSHLNNQDRQAMVQLQQQQLRYTQQQQRQTAAHMDSLQQQHQQLQLQPSSVHAASNNDHSGPDKSSHHDDLHLIHDLEEISDDYEHEIMVNIDALLNESITNFEDHFDENNQQQHLKKEATVSSAAGGIAASEEPVTDLLQYLRTVHDQRPMLTSPIDEFSIHMGGQQLLEKAARLSPETQEAPWSISYLPGNRVPRPPQPPPLASPLQQSDKSAKPTVPAQPSAPTVPSAASVSRQNTEYFQLLPPTPSVYLDCKKDVHSPELRQFCLSQPVVVIRNLASTLRMDFGVFSTKSLVEANPSHKIEQRIQDLQPPDENRDSGGKTVLRCNSSRSTTTIQDYASYQARTFVEAKREERISNNGGGTGGSGSAYNILAGATTTNGATLVNGQASGSTLDDSSRTDPSTGASVSSLGDDKKKRRKIQFGTNCDLSDETRWFPQLHELAKLPGFLRVVSACNMLSHCGCTIQGMNSVQLYMKVPGCRTPGHQENNNFCSVNMNVGPGDCEWFCVPEQYWGAVSQLCQQHRVDYLSGSWWPSLDELKQRHVPVYRFIQRPGDLVWINSGTVHWVQAVGWCNNVAWNVGPLVSRQYNLAMERYEYNKLRMYQSIVPMVHLSWQLARDLKITDSHLYQLIKYTLMVSLIQCGLVWQYLEKARVPMVLQPREDNEPTQHCTDCECEVFDIFLIKQIRTGNTDVKYEPRCLNCALKVNPALTPFKAIYQYKMAELVDVYDSFRFQSTPIAAYSVSR